MPFRPTVLKPLARWGALAALLALAACGGGGGSPAPVTPPPVVTPSHAIGGAISGLTGTVELQNNGSETLSVSTDGNFTFTTAVNEGSAYAVTITSQPVGQTCSVNHGSGTVGTSPVTNVAVVCAANAYPVGGTVSGLAGSLTLQNNGADDLPLSSNGGFSFATSVAHGASYNVTVHSQPVGQTCTVSNGSGTMGAAAVTNVAVTCHVNTYTVGGTVSGLVGSISLQNNGSDSLTQTSDGAFTFTTPVASGGSYSVTVSSQPSNQTCTVSNGSGSAVSSNITNVTVNCATNSTTVSAATYNVTIPVGGASSTLTVSNDGSFPATNVMATLPGGWSGVTQDASDCTTIAPGGSCTLSFTSTDAYVANGAVAIAGDNTNVVNTPMAFSVNGFLVFDVTGPGAGWVIDTTDMPATVWGTDGVSTAATSYSDGAANTNAILVTPGHASGTAAAACRAKGSDWSLPAACQLSPVTPGCSSTSASVLSLWQYGFGNPGANNVHLSSTEDPASNSFARCVVGTGTVPCSTRKSVPQPSRCIAPVSW